MPKYLSSYVFAMAILVTMGGGSLFAEIDLPSFQSPAGLEPLLRNQQFKGHWQSFADKNIFRARMQLDGVQIEGQDHIVEFDNEGHSRIYVPKTISPTGRFALNDAQAIELARATIEHISPRLKMLFRSASGRTPVWTPHRGELRPAYKTRLPASRVENLLDMWIDAEDGRILRIEKAAKTFNAPARLFQFEPAPYVNDETLQYATKDVVIKDLLSGDAGSYVKGEHFQTRNCCPFVRCPGKTQNCDEKELLCASESDPHSFPYVVVQKIDSSLLGLNGKGIPERLYVASIECARLPKATLEKGQNGQIGFFPKAVDEQTAGALDDDFSEIQSYFSLTSFFDYIRRIKGEESFCLRPEAMECDGLGQAQKDEQGNPTRSTMIFVNQLLPHPSLDPKETGDQESILAQINSGLGLRAEQPIIITSLARVENAAYVPASGEPIKDEPASLDEALGHLIQPYDFFVFFQGLNDYSYDGSIAFHEFTHAVIQTLAPDLATIVADSQGLNTQPGAFNEAAADYFSSSFRNNPNIGLYASSSTTGLDGTARNISEPKRCPFDITGEVHDDSLMWSSALWKIRQDIANRFGQDRIDMWDRAILEAIAKAQTDDDFAKQVERIEENVRGNRFLSELLPSIHAVFAKHGLRECQRNISLSYLNEQGELSFHRHPYLLHASPLNLGFDNFSPPPANFVVTLPPATGSFRITWQQSGAIDSLVSSAPVESRSSAEALIALTTEANPIVWGYDARNAFATFQGEDIDTNSSPFGLRSIQGNEGWFIEKVLPDLSCETRQLYVAFINPHQGLDNDVMMQTEVSIGINPSKRAECSARGVPSLVLAADTENQGSVTRDSGIRGNTGCGCKLYEPTTNPGATLTEVLIYLGLFYVVIRNQRKGLATTLKLAD
jgi:hypothetical protein